jgi:hypothetical protein
VQNCGHDFGCWGCSGIGLDMEVVVLASQGFGEAIVGCSMVGMVGYGGNSVVVGVVCVLVWFECKYLGLGKMWMCGGLIYLVFVIEMKGWYWNVFGARGMLAYQIVGF